MLKPHLATTPPLAILAARTSRGTIIGVHYHVGAPPFDANQYRLKPCAPAAVNISRLVSMCSKQALQMSIFSLPFTALGLMWRPSVCSVMNTTGTVLDEASLAKHTSHETIVTLLITGTSQQSLPDSVENLDTQATRATRHASHTALAHTDPPARG
jgi:hypothetical protein